MNRDGAERGGIGRDRIDRKGERERWRCEKHVGEGCRVAKLKGGEVSWSGVFVNGRI